jgi:hypothetical protein
MASNAAEDVAWAPQADSPPERVRPFARLPRLPLQPGPPGVNHAVDGDEQRRGATASGAGLG